MILHSLFLGFIGAPGLPELAIIALIILLLFGGSKLPTLMRNLGRSTRVLEAASEGILNLRKIGRDHDPQMIVVRRNFDGRIDEQTPAMFRVAE